MLCKPLFRLQLWFMSVENKQRDHSKAGVIHDQVHARDILY